MLLRCFVAALLCGAVAVDGEMNHISVAQPIFGSVNASEASKYVMCEGTAAVFSNLTLAVQVHKGPCVDELQRLLGYIPQQHSDAFFLTLSATANELNSCQKLKPYGVRIDSDIKMLYWIFECTKFAELPQNLMTDPRSWEWFVWTVLSLFFVVPVTVLVGNCVSDSRMYSNIELEIQSYMKEADLIMEKWRPLTADAVKMSAAVPVLKQPSTPPAANLSLPDSSTQESNDAPLPKGKQEKLDDVKKSVKDSSTPSKGTSKPSEESEKGATGSAEQPLQSKGSEEPTKKAIK